MTECLVNLVAHDWMCVVTFVTKFLMCALYLEEGGLPALYGEFTFVCMCIGTGLYTRTFFMLAVSIQFPNYPTLEYWYLKFSLTRHLSNEKNQWQGRIPSPEMWISLRFDTSFFQSSDISFAREYRAIVWLICGVYNVPFSAESPGYMD